MAAFCIIVILIAVVVVFIAMNESDRKQEEIKRLHAVYQQNLDLLRQSPTSSEYHENALESGRAYANATRDKKGVTLFDETALANDIRAVTANASKIGQSASEEPAPSTLTHTLDERIAALQKLRAAGLISDEEFDQKRKAIIDSI